MVFYLNQDDTEPALRAILKDAKNTVAKIFAGDVVHFRMTPEIPALRGDVDAVAFVNNANAGDVEYRWLPADTTVPGTFRGEFYIAKANGARKSFPNNETITVIIRAKAAAAP